MIEKNKLIWQCQGKNPVEKWSIDFRREWK